MSGLTFFLPKLTLGCTSVGWGVGCHPITEVFLIFFPHDKTSACDVLIKLFAYPSRALETSLVVVSYYGYEI